MQNCGNILVILIVLFLLGKALIQVDNSSFKTKFKHV